MSQNLSSLYSIDVFGPTDNLIADLTGMAILRNLTIERNGIGGANFDIDLFGFEEYCRNKIYIPPMSILYPNVNWVKIRRGNKYLFSGQINYAKPTLKESQSIINVKVPGQLNLFKKRFTAAERIFTGVDAGTIASTLLSESQALTNGDYGITAGTIQTSVNRDRLYTGYKCISDAIIELSQVINGFDFEFTYDKKFNVYYPNIGTDRTGEITFEYPGNIKSIEYEYDGETMVNEDILLGSGITRVRNESVYQATFKLRQQRDDQPDIITTQTLDDKGDEVLRLYKNLNPVITSLELFGNKEPFIGSYWIGDRVKIKTSSLQTFNPINNQTYKIDSISINLDENMSEIVSLGLSLL